MSAHQVHLWAERVVVVQAEHNGCPCLLCLQDASDGEPLKIVKVNDIGPHRFEQSADDALKLGLRHLARRISKLVQRWGKHRRVDDLEHVHAEPVCMAIDT